MAPRSVLPVFPWLLMPLTLGPRSLKFQWTCSRPHASHPRPQEINGNELGMEVSAFQSRYCIWRADLASSESASRWGRGGCLLSCLEPSINGDPYLIWRHTRPTEATSELHFLFSAVARKLFSTFCESGSIQTAPVSVLTQRSGSSDSSMSSAHWPGCLWASLLIQSSGKHCGHGPKIYFLLNFTSQNL